MIKIDIYEKLNSIIMGFALKEKRIFSNESQFQFALAWTLAKEFGEENVVLELLYEIGKVKRYIDIVVFEKDQCFPIELKYKTAYKETTYRFGECEYTIAGQGATDTGCYGFWSDISRIEDMIYEAQPHISYKGKDYKVERGFAIILTNEKSYYNGPRKGGKPYYWESFSLKEGSFIEEKRLFWKKPDNKTEDPWIEDLDRAKSMPAIVLKGQYKIQWEKYELNYEKMTNQPNDYSPVFMFLNLEVKRHS